MNGFLFPSKSSFSWRILFLSNRGELSRLTIIYEYASCVGEYQLRDPKSFLLFFSYVVTWDHVAVKIVKCQSAVIPNKLNQDLDREKYFLLIKFVNVNDRDVDLNTCCDVVFIPNCHIPFTHAFSALQCIFKSSTCLS